jgi:heterodisulfide reductase subunit C
MKSVHPIDFREKLVSITSQDPALCYQCGKCSAGCPVREYAESAPNRVVRFVQLGFYEKAISSPSIWLCAGCQTCSSRCPQGFDLAKFMDALREIAIENDVKPSDPDTLEFHKSFLNQIKNFGRSYEIGFLLEYKLKTQHFFQDLDLAPSTLLKGKLGILPPKVKGKKQIKKIFDKSERDKQ